MTKQAYTQQCQERAIAIKHILASTGKKAVTQAELDEYYDRKSEYESEQHAEQAAELYLERKAEAAYSDEELSGMCPPPEEDWHAPM